MTGRAYPVPLEPERARTHARTCTLSFPQTTSLPPPRTARGVRRFPASRPLHPPRRTGDQSPGRPSSRSRTARRARPLRRCLRPCCRGSPRTRTRSGTRRWGTSTSHARASETPRKPETRRPPRRKRLWSTPGTTRRTRRETRRPAGATRESARLLARENRASPSPFRAPCWPPPPPPRKPRMGIQFCRPARGRLLLLNPRREPVTRRTAPGSIPRRRSGSRRSFRPLRGRTRRQRRGSPSRWIRRGSRSPARALPRSARHQRALRVSSPSPPPRWRGNARARRTRAPSRNTRRAAKRPTRRRKRRRTETRPPTRPPTRLRLVRREAKEEFFRVPGVPRVPRPPGEVKELFPGRITRIPRVTGTRFPRR